jgi:hypothetical protein
MKHKVFHYFISMKQNADHIRVHTQARQVRTNAMARKAGRNYPRHYSVHNKIFSKHSASLSIIFSFFPIQAAFTEYLIKPTLAIFFAFFNEELLDFNQFTDCHYTQNTH